MSEAKLPKLRKAVKRKWLEALRSGEFDQGKGALCIESGKNKYCCLGVLCEVALKDGVKMPVDPNGYNGRTYYGEVPRDLSLPEEVVKYAFWPTRRPQGYMGDAQVDTADGRRWLSNLNDNGKSFSEIADLIDASL